MSTFEDGDNGLTVFWTIENFSLCKPNANLSLKSQVFRMDTIPQWYLVIEQENNNYLGAYICSSKKRSKSCTLILSISLMTIFGWIPIVKNVTGKLIPHDRYKGYGTHKLMEWRKLLQEKYLYLPNDGLTIGFHISKQSIKMAMQCSMVSKMINDQDLVNCSHQEFCVQKPDNLECFPAKCTTRTNPTHVKEKKTKNIQTDKPPEDKYLSELLPFFKEKSFSYVTLKTNDKDFAVQKAILCAKSPVFNAMFEAKLKENENNVVEIPDVDSDTMDRLLHFLHLEPLTSLKWSEAMSLYYAADKYQMDSLKEVCVLFLQAGMTEQNACDAFVLADMHQDSNLMNRTLKYFFIHSKNILRSEGWKSLLLTKTELASNILCSLTEKL